MAYRVYYDEYLLYDPIMESYKLIDPVWETELSKVKSLTYTIPVSHPNFEFLELMKPLVKIYRDGVLKFKGRIYKMTNDFYGNRKCECEDAMAFLNDSLIAPFSFRGTTGDLFRQLITWHNERVSESQQIQIGNVVGEDEIEINRWQESYRPTLDVFKSKILDPFGGYLKIRYDEQERPVIDFLKEITETAEQHVTYSVNLANHIIDENARDFATAVVPLGIQHIELDPESHDETRVTIEEVNGGKDYLINEDLANVYGIIYQKTSKTTHPSIVNPSTLMEKGQDDLRKAVVYKKTVTVNFVDLGFIEEVNSPETGQNIIIDSAPHGGTVSYLLRAMKVDLSNPAMTEVTLGDERENFLLKAQKDLENVSARVTTIENTYLTEAQRIAQTTIENNTSILQSAEAIILEALQNYVSSSNYETEIGQLRSAISVNAGNITLTNQAIEEVQSATNGRFSNIETYVRFDENGLTLGKNDSSDQSIPIKLRLSNDKLYFFSGTDDTSDVSTALAYFDTNGLTVKNVNATNSLTIGDFYWQPEQNGSLSLVYIGVNT